MHNLRKITFKNFKAFRTFSISLKEFNVLVGPNNAGKSTILVALRILWAGLRRAHSRTADLLNGPQGRRYGYKVELKDISIADENIFHNYDDSIPAIVDFEFINNEHLTLFFPVAGTCYMFPSIDTPRGISPTEFRKRYNFSIGFVPILGPVEHEEKFVEKETARLSLYSHGASRNFRNIWFHFPDKFDEFRSLLSSTWPGMDIEPPKLQPTHVPGKPILTMFCPEERMPREIFWAGFGFQVWCQLLTQVVQSATKTLFIIDEPDIYLHSDLQRQLIVLLRNLGPDIIIATHSTELISEADADEIVVVDKKRTLASRVRDPTTLTNVFRSLGSNLNPLLTQLAKTRRVLFVEGKDFQIFSKAAAKIGLKRVATREGFAVVVVEGFNPERVRSIKVGIEETLGTKVESFLILDRDYRSEEEISKIMSDCLKYVDHVHIHSVKEVENFLLSASAIDRAASLRCAEKIRRTGAGKPYANSADYLLKTFSTETKAECQAQHLFERNRFLKGRGDSHESAIMTSTIETFEANWAAPSGPLSLISGKDALSAINNALQTDFEISISASAILNAMAIEEVPDELKKLLGQLEAFAKKP